MSNKVGNAICRAQASEQSLTLGAVDYYADDEVGLGLFENVSFAGETEIIKQTKRIAGLDIKPGSSLLAALKRFDTIAHLRHAAVHSRGALNSKNSTAIGVDGGGILALRLAEVHAVAGICRATVRAYNRFLYQELLRRWEKSGAIKGNWREDWRRFTPLFELFRSTKDAATIQSARDAYNLFRT